MPPEVGYADTSSDIVNPMIRMNTDRIGHDHEIEIGPPLLKPAPKLVKHPARIEMIENEIAKLEKLDQLRFRSCAYPSSASRWESASSGISWASGMCVLISRSGSHWRSVWPRPQVTVNGLTLD